MANIFKSFATFYSSLLKANPLRTKMLTTYLIFTLGDYTC